MTCTGCGARVFILPLSPLTGSPGTQKLSRSKEVRPPASGLLSWRWLILAAGVSLAVVTIAVLALLNKKPEQNLLADPSRDVIRHREAGQQALAAGKFLIAVEEFTAALAIGQQHPHSVSLHENRELTRLFRQASLLSELVSEPLEEILRQGNELSRLDEREWRAAFSHRYKGKAVVFNADVRREASGKYHLAYSVFSRGKPAILDLGPVAAFESIPWHRPQRLLFGTRLMDVAPSAEGSWTLHFDPESTVLLTDLGAATAACGQPAEELMETVRQQAEWIGRLP